MEQYQTQDNNEETLIETDYEVSEIFADSAADSNDIEVDDFENFQKQQTVQQEEQNLQQVEQPVERNGVLRNNYLSAKQRQKRKYSFVWQYFQPIQGTNQFQCLLCQSCVCNQTSNLARHLASAHDITNKLKEGLENLVRIRPSRSFIWKYCTKEDSKHARCHLCNKILYFGSGNTANISKHLRRLHSDLVKETKNSNSPKMDEETMQATASLSHNSANTYDDDVNNDGRSSVDITSAERKERRGASYVWNYVEKLSRHTIRCRLCTKIMSFHGTANVITHLQRRHNVLGEPGSLNQIITAKPDSFSELDNNDDYENNEYEGKKYGRKSMSTASVVWKFCTRISQDQVRCCFCKKNLSYQGTSNLQRHLHRMHGVITHGRLSKATEDFVAIKEDSFKVPENIDFIWQFCSQLDDHQRTKCNMCDALFDSKDIETIVKHLAMVHSVEMNHNSHGDHKPIIIRTKKRNRHAAFESDDEDDFDAKWSKLDEAHEQQLANEFDESNIKRDDSLYDDIIEEDPNNYDEEPFDPTLAQDIPQANPLSPHSSHRSSPQPQTNIMYQNQDQEQQQLQGQTLQPNNLLPPLDTKVLLKLQEDRLRMETDYFREKAGYYRMQKYLTALQAKKVRLELERFSSGEATIVATTDLNGAYAVEVIPEHMTTTQQ